VNARLAASGHAAAKAHYYRFVGSAASRPSAGEGEGDGELLLAGRRRLAELGPPPELTAVAVPNEAQPELLAAREAFLSADVRDVHELMCFEVPPNRILSTCLALCGLLSIQVDEPGRELLDPTREMWRTVRRELLESLSTKGDEGSMKSVFNQVRDHDPDANPEKDLAALLAYVRDPESQPDKVCQASRYCGAMARWLHALAKYAKLAVDGELGPKGSEEPDW